MYYIHYTIADNMILSALILFVILFMISFLRGFVDMWREADKWED